MMSWRSVVRNRYALGAVALTIVLQVLAVHLPALAQILRTRPLTPGEWLVALGFAVVPARRWTGAKAVVRPQALTGRGPERLTPSPYPTICQTGGKLRTMPRAISTSVAVYTRFDSS